MAREVQSWAYLVSGRNSVTLDVIVFKRRNYSLMSEDNVNECQVIFVVGLY